MTTRECAKFLNLNGGPFFDADLPFDFPFSCASVAGSLLSNYFAVVAINIKVLLVAY